ncbi:MAG: hypothetical protein ABEJ71_01820 [Halodesulfurarchaeum sp.]
MHTRTTLALAVLAVVGLLLAVPAVSAHGGDGDFTPPYAETNTNPTTNTTTTNATEAWAAYMLSRMGPAHVAWMEEQMGLSLEEMASFMAEHATGVPMAPGEGYAWHDRYAGQYHENVTNATGDRYGPGYGGHMGPGYGGPMGPGYDGHMGPGYDGQYGPGYDGHMGPGYDGQYGPGYDGHTGPGYDGQYGPGYGGHMGPGYGPGMGHGC